MSCARQQVGLMSGPSLAGTASTSPEHVRLAGVHCPLSVHEYYHNQGVLGTVTPDQGCIATCTQWVCCLIKVAVQSGFLPYQGRIAIALLVSLRKGIRLALLLCAWGPVPHAWG